MGNPFEQLENRLLSIEQLLTEIKNKEVKVQAPEQKKYLTRTEVCDYIGVSRQTLASWQEDGSLKATKIHSRYRYLKSDVDRFMGDRKGL